MDLSDIDPERRREVMRRVAILDRYLAIQIPDAVDDVAFAGEMGVGVGQFLRLARIWRESRRPELLPGARGRRRAGRTGISERSPPMSDAGVGRVVIDDVAVDMPVKLPSARSLPIMHGLFDAAGGPPIAWSLGVGRIHATSAAALLLALPASGRPIEEVSVPAELSSGPLPNALRGAGIAVSTRRASGRLGEEARRLVGGRIGGIALRTRATLRADAGASSTLGRMDIEEAREFLGRAIGPLRTIGAERALPSGVFGERLRIELERIKETGA